MPTKNQLIIRQLRKNGCLGYQFQVKSNDVLDILNDGKFCIKINTSKFSYSDIANELPFWKKYRNICCKKLFEKKENQEKCFKINKPDLSENIGSFLEGSGILEETEKKISLNIVGNVQLCDSPSTVTQVIVPLNSETIGNDIKLPKISCCPKCPHQPVIQITLDADPSTNSSVNSILWNPLFPSLSFNINYDSVTVTTVSVNISICYIYNRCKTGTKVIEKDFVAELTCWDFGPITIGGKIKISNFHRTLRGNPVSPSTVKTMTFNGTIPGPTIEADVGDRIIAHFTNNLPPSDDQNLDQTNIGSGGIVTDSSMHWHGIEANNVSDGTSVTQNETEINGGTYTYDFIASRPGLYFYHPHMAPLNQLFQGMFGPLIVRDCADKILTKNGILPKRTQNVVLSDVKFIEQINEDTGQTQIKMMDMQNEGSDDAFGDNYLINGTTNCIEMNVKKGEGLRLRLYNASIIGYSVISFNNGTGENSGTIYRVGSQEGLLDNVRVEGDGTMGSYMPGHPEGTILLPTAAREDVVIFFDPSIDATEAYLTTTGLDYSGASVDVCPNPPLNIIKFNISCKTVKNPYTISVGDPIRTNALVCDPVVSLKNRTTSSLVDPSTLNPVKPGSDNPVITFDSANGKPAIDSINGTFEFGTDDYHDVPHVDSSRYGRIGDVLELSIQNVLGAHHPLHLHGFSMQPCKIEEIDSNGDLTGTTLYEWNYNEYVDVIDTQPLTRTTFRIILDDRPNPDNSFGGALGRWLFHCHTLRHAARGMISELVVLPRKDV